MLAALLVHAPPALLPKLGELIEVHAEDRTLEVLLGLPLPPDRHRLLASVEAAQGRRAALAEARAVLTTAATEWRDAWGLSPQPFRITVACTDVPRSHKKPAHLREQTSRLDIVIGHVPVQGPELDVAWSIQLRPGSGEPKHGFAPSRWEGELRATMLERGEVTGTFREQTDSPIRKGRVATLRGVIDDIPRLLRELESLTQRSFHPAEANIIAVVGEKPDPALRDRVRTWLMTK